MKKLDAHNAVSLAAILTVCMWIFLLFLHAVRAFAILVTATFTFALTIITIAVMAWLVRYLIRVWRSE